MAAAREILVFDMDGVLVEVSESYRETIVRTVEHFTGQRVERARIQDYKNQGGWNNDWRLSQKICADLGFDIEYQAVIDKFNELFLGPNGDGEGGLIHREVWMANDGLIERLAKRFQLAIFTGRTRLELEITLARHAPAGLFEPTVCSYEVEHGKPAPDGLHKIAALHPGAKLWYVGDTVDDAACANAAGAPFIGVAGQDNPRREELVKLFQAGGAVAVVGHINELEGVLSR